MLVHIDLLIALILLTSLQLIIYGAIMVHILGVVAGRLICLDRESKSPWALMQTYFHHKRTLCSHQAMLLSYHHLNHACIIGFGGYGKWALHTMQLLISESE